MVYGNGSRPYSKTGYRHGHTLLIVGIFFVYQSNTSQIMMFPGIGNWFLCLDCRCGSEPVHQYASYDGCNEKTETSNYHHSIKYSSTVLVFPRACCFSFAVRIFLPGHSAFGIASLLGTAGSVCINIVLYTGLHAYSSREELAATIPLAL